MQDQDGNAQDERNRSEDFDEMLVFVSFTNFEDSKFLANAKEIEFRCLETADPYCMIDGIEFSGKYEANLGTRLFLSRKSGSCVGQTAKRLRFDMKSIQPVNEYQIAGTDTFHPDRGQS